MKAVFVASSNLRRGVFEGGRELVHLVGDEMGMRNAGIGGFEDLHLAWPRVSLFRFFVGEGTANEFSVCVLPWLPGWCAALSDVLTIREAWSGGEDAASVGAIEGAGFGGRIEELWGSQRMVREVVDGFVECGRGS